MFSLVTRYAPQSDDVSEAVDRALFERLRQLTPLERLQLAVRATSRGAVRSSCCTCRR